MDGTLIHRLGSQAFSSTGDYGLASPSYEQILTIQNLDLAMRQLRHKIDNHPARQKMADLSGRMAEHETSKANTEERRHDLERQQKRLGDEVASIEKKRQETDGKLYGGDVTAAKELLALQDEAATLLERQRRVEDDQLLLMEQQESVAEQLSALNEIGDEFQAEMATLQNELTVAIAEFETELEGVASERSSAAGPAVPELLTRYEDLRDQYDGVAVARLVNGRCDGCHIQLSAMAVDQVGKMPDDAVVTCEECGRLLVR